MDSGEGLPEGIVRLKGDIYRAEVEYLAPKWPPLKTRRRISAKEDLGNDPISAYIRIYILIYIFEFTFVCATTRPNSRGHFPNLPLH